LCYSPIRPPQPRRHRQRNDIKARDVKRIRDQSYEQLCTKASELHGGATNTFRRNWVRDSLRRFCRDLAEGCEEQFPELFALVKLNYIKLKEAEAAAASPIPGSDPSGEAAATVEAVARVDALTVLKGAKADALQLLSDIGSKTARYFVCRNAWCSEKGVFCSLNTNWITTAFGSDGTAASGHGWQWACPNCGQVYNPKSKAVPFHLVFHAKSDDRWMLSAWPATAEESSLLALTEATSGIVRGSDWVDASMEATCDRMLQMAESFSVPAKMEPFQVTQAAKDHIEEINRKRTEAQGKQKWKIFHYSHLKESFPACFIPYKEGETPVLSIEQTKYLVGGMFNFKKGDGEA
jgi:hypothetical protein